MPESDNQLVPGLTLTHSISNIYATISTSLVINTLLTNLLKSFVKVCLILSGLPLLSGATISYAHQGAATAYAIPLTGLRIDGNLNDWPKDMIRYPILNVGRDTGPTDLDGEDLTNSPDFSADMMVGFNPEDNLIYLAVRVRDDIEIIGSDAQHTDACLVYLDGLNTVRKIVHSPGLTAEELPILKYAMCPPGGSYQKGENPCLRLGDITKTKTTCVYRRNGDISVYEWAVQVFDQFPGSPTRLAVGKTIGIDVELGEKDTETDMVTWISWARFALGKEIDTSLLGDMILLKSYRELGTLACRVTKGKNKEAYRNLNIDIYRGGNCVGTGRTNREGLFELAVLPGDYTLKPHRGQGVESAEMLVTVKAGRKTTVDFTVIPLELPEILERSIARYTSLKGYRDTTIVEMRTVRPGQDNRTTIPSWFLFERPNRLRIQPTLPSPGGRAPDIDVFSDGTLLVTHREVWNQYIQTDVPGVLSYSDLRGSSISGGIMFVPILMMSDDPRKELIEGLYDVKETGTENLDGIPVTIFELSKHPASLKGLRTPGKDRDDVLIPVKLWIGSKDFLIRKVEVELDMERLSEGIPEKQREWMKGMTMILTDTHRTIAIDPIFSDNDFTFVPPEGAVLVDRFIPPSGSVAAVSELRGKQIQDLTLKNIDGREVKLSDFRGKVLVVNFWATWCKPCLEEIPAFVALQSRYAAKGFSVIGISTDTNPDVVRAFAEKNRIQYPILMADEKVQRDYRVVGLPTTFVIDRNSMIRYLNQGAPRDLLIFQQYVEELLNE